MSQYPGARYPFQDKIQLNIKAMDCNRRYSILTYLMFFFSFSFVGWVWEVGYGLYKNGVFINRGVLYGPWLPIYGTGGILILLFLRKFFQRPVLTFFMTMIICSVVEYATSWYLEMCHGVKWWDYSGYFLNINGRICLEGSVVFGIGGVAFIYIFAPMLDNLFARIPKWIRILIVIVLTALFLFDLWYSHDHVHVGEGITTTHVSMIGFVRNLLI